MSGGKCSALVQPLDCKERIEFCKKKKMRPSALLSLASQMSGKRSKINATAF